MRKIKKTPSELLYNVNHNYLSFFSFFVSFFLFYYSPFLSFPLWFLSHFLSSSLCMSSTNSPTSLVRLSLTPILFLLYPLLLKEGVTAWLCLSCCLACVLGASWASSSFSCCFYSWPTPPTTMSTSAGWLLKEISCTQFVFCSCIRE